MRVQWGSIVSWLPWLRECPEALGIFQMDLKNICKFWSLIKTHHLLVCNIINMMPYNGCSQMLHISLKTEKSFIAHPWRLLCVVGLDEYSAHDWRGATSGTARSSYLAWVGPMHVTIPLKGSKQGIAKIGHLGPLSHGLVDNINITCLGTLLSTWISNQIPSKMWDEITNSLPNLYGYKFGNG